MSQPAKGDLHVNRPLTNILVSFIQEDRQFIATKIFPMVPVTKQSDTYFRYPMDQWYTDEARQRAPGTESAGSGWDVEEAPPYFAKVYAFHKDVDDQTRSNVDEPIDMDRDSTRFVSQKMMLKWEQEFFTNFWQTSLWTGSTTGADIVPATKWDAATGDPVDDVLAQIDACETKCGFRPNKIVVTTDVHRALKKNAGILDRIKYTQTGVVTEDLLAALFEVDEYHVARSLVNTAKEGATRAMARRMSGDQVLLCYAAPSPSLYLPSAGYTFTWSGMFGAGSEGVRMKSFRMEHLASDRIEGESAFDMKVIATDCGVFFDNVLT